LRESEDGLNGSKIGLNDTPGNLAERDSVVRRAEPKYRRRQLRGEREVGIEKPGIGSEPRWADEALVEAQDARIVSAEFVLARPGSGYMNDRRTSGRVDQLDERLGEVVDEGGGVMRIREAVDRSPRSKLF